MKRIVSSSMLFCVFLGALSPLYAERKSLSRLLVEHSSGNGETTFSIEEQSVKGVTYYQVVMERIDFGESKVYSEGIFEIPEITERENKLNMDIGLLFDMCYKRLTGANYNRPNCFVDRNQRNICLLIDRSGRGYFSIERSAEDIIQQSRKMSRTETLKSMTSNISLFFISGSFSLEQLVELFKPVLTQEKAF